MSGGLSFFDTVLGVHFAETLTRELPRINDNLSCLQKKQRAYEITDDEKGCEMLKEVMNGINEGKMRYIDSFEAAGLPKRRIVIVQIIR